MKRRHFISLLASVIAAGPLSALGAQRERPKIGVMFFGYPDPATFEKGLRSGLANRGYEDGKNVELIVRNARGRSTELDSLAAELIGLRPDVIVAYPTTSGIAVQRQTSEIPIVVYGGDLEATKLVTSLARPGANVTGVSGSTGELATKGLELILEMVPRIRRVAVLINADSRFGLAMLQHVQATADIRKIEIKSVLIAEADSMDRVFEDLDGWKPDALLVHPALPLKLIAALALERRWPAVSPNSTFCGLGGLGSYSPDIETLADQCATFVDKILTGRRPSDLPVELPTRFRLELNLKTARTIGVSIPGTLLARADEVIE